MTPNQYQIEASRTECNQRESLRRMTGTHLADPLVPIRLTHACIGMTNEAAELTSLLQKWVYYGKSFTLDEIKAKVVDEGGDVLWHLCQAFTCLGIKLEDVMTANNAKLRARYPDKWSGERAADENRDREKEAKVQNPIHVVRDDPEADIPATDANAILNQFGPTAKFQDGDK